MAGGETKKLINGVARALDSFLALPVETFTPEPYHIGPKKRRRTLLREVPKTPFLQELIERELGEKLRVAAGRALDETAYDLAYWARQSETQSIERGLLELLEKSTGATTRQIAERYVGYLVGPALPLDEYLSVDIVPELAKVQLFDEWELIHLDYASDAKLPIHEWHGLAVAWRNPGRLHADEGYGALRRPRRDPAIPTNPSGTTRVVVWPILALNLFVSYPIKVQVTYFVEPGRRVVPHPSGPDDVLGRMGWRIPHELHRWEHDPLGGRVERVRVLNAYDSSKLERFAARFGSRLTALEFKLRDRLIRAADHYLFINYNTKRAASGIELPDIHPSEVAFRWTVAIEGLLASEGGTDLTRKVAQRAAVLVGRDDADRLHVERIVREAYRARSAYAHGGSEKEADLLAIKDVVRRVFLSWLAVAAEHGRAAERVLDDALLSQHVLEDRVQRFVRDFWEDIDTQEAPLT